MANYTEKAIFRAFEELLEEKPFDKITVSAIVSKSEVSANTFYYHFQDIYDLLDKWLDRKKNQFFAMTQLTGSWTDRLREGSSKRSWSSFSSFHRLSPWRQFFPR